MRGTKENKRYKNIARNNRKLAPKEGDSDRRDRASGSGKSNMVGDDHESGFG